MTAATLKNFGGIFVKFLEPISNVFQVKPQKNQNYKKNTDHRQFHRGFDQELIKGSIYKNKKTQQKCNAISLLARQDIWFHQLTLPNAYLVYFIFNILSSSYISTMFFNIRFVSTMRCIKIVCRSMAPRLTRF